MVDELQTRDSLIMLAFDTMSKKQKKIKIKIKQMVEAA